MEIELEKYKNYSQSIRWILTVPGLWPTLPPVWKRILSFISFFTTVIVMLTIFNFCFQNITNVMVLTKGMGLSISFSSSFIKATLFLLHHNDLVYLNEHLTMRYLRDLEQTKNRRDLLNRLGKFTLLTYAHVISASLSMTVYVIKPLFAARKHGKYVRAYPSVYPFSYEPGGVIHWIIYGIEVVGSQCMWTSIIGVDCVFGLYTLQTCGELRILAKDFRQLHVSKNYKKNLRDCIQRHYLLINVKNKLESIFGLISIWQATTGAFVLCSLIFQISELAKNNGSITQTVHMFCYLIPKFVQIFLYAWSGNLINEESGACLDSIYYSQWTRFCNRTFKNDILIVLFQEPLALVAKGCMVIQLDMFTKVVKASVSYFCLLRTLHGNK